MSNYNKPGVYVEESLSVSTPILTDASQTVAVFIGATDRGPTTKVGNNYVGVPTLVTSWTDFVNKFCFASTVFSASADPNTADMRYAMRTFFDNNGSQAYVQRVVSTDAAPGAFRMYGTVSTTFTGTVTASTISGGIEFTVATATTIATGSALTVSGFTGTAAAANETWIVSTVVATTNPAKVQVIATTPSTFALSTAAAGTASWGVASTSAKGIQISANSVGTWSNNLFVTAAPNLDPTLFDLKVYYNPASTSINDVSNSTLVENIPSLSLDPLSPYYAVTRVSSDYISVAGVNTTSTTGTTILMPYYNAATYTTAGATPIPVSVGNPSAVSVSTTSPSIVGTVTTASNGTAGGSNIDDITSQIDFVTGPIVINYPTNTTASLITTSTKLLNYAGTRGDAFVVIDPPYASVASALANVLSVANGTTAPSYGAMYYPHITITDPVNNRTLRDVPPGAAVVAAILATDAQRGPWKAPAGVTTNIKPAVSIYYALTNADYTLNNSSIPQLNIIRSVPGTGWCIMGARTLSKSLADNYVPVRRMLGYLRRSLVEITNPYVFEPNNSTTWALVKASIESFMYRQWQNGALAGDTPDQSYYVKCDSTINTATTIQNGELQVEVGVALSRPAEFIVITLGQSQAGTTLTTSV